MEKTEEPITINVIMLGESRVGKTALFKCYDNKEWNPSHYTTLGMELMVRETIIDNQRVKAKIWDTAGQEKFRTISKTFYQQADGIVLTYSVAEKESFTKLHLWITQIQENAPEEIIKFLVANKVDLIDDREVTEEEEERLQKQIKWSTRRLLLKQSSM